MADKIYFHIDVNSAFLSWTAVERLKHGLGPDIRTIPSIIGGDISKRRGIVVAKSIPAKKYGIITGEPVVDAFKKCPHLKSYAPDHALYTQYSKDLMEMLNSYSSDVSQYSIDECFMEYVPGVFPPGTSVVEAAAMIKDRVRNTFGFTVNIGISTNKLLAKMASDFKKPDLVHTLFPEEVPKKMWPLPVGDLFTVGKSTATRLELLGIKTIGDLAKTPPDILTSHLKSHGRVIWEYANGIENVSIDDRANREVKGIGNSTTISFDVTDKETAYHYLMQLAESVSARLRKAHVLAGMISVEIKYSTFESVSHQKQLLTPENTTQGLYKAACKLFDELWNEEPIRLLGIRTSKLSSDEQRQMNIFDLQTNEKQQKLDKALDNIRSKFGTASVMRASQLGAMPPHFKQDDHEPSGPL